MSKDSQSGEHRLSPSALVSSITSWILSPFSSSNPAQQPVQEVCGVLNAELQPPLPEPPSAPPSPTTPPSSPASEPSSSALVTRPMSPSQGVVVIHKRQSVEGSDAQPLTQGEDDGFFYTSHSLKRTFSYDSDEEDETRNASTSRFPSSSSGLNEDSSASPDVSVSPSPQSPKNAAFQRQTLEYWLSFFADRIEVLESRIEECNGLLSYVTEAIVSLTASAIAATPEGPQAIGIPMFEAAKQKSYLATKKLELQNQIRNLEIRHNEIASLEAEQKDGGERLAAIVKGFMGAEQPPAESEQASSWRVVADSAIAAAKAVGVVGASVVAGGAAVATLGAGIVVSEALFVGWTLTSNLVIYGTLGLVANGGAAAVPVALVTWTGTGALVLKKLNGSTDSPEALEKQRREVLREEEREWEEQMKAAGGALRTLQILDRESVTIDFADIEKDIIKNVGSDLPLSGYHSLHSLSTNVCIEPLRELREALRDGHTLSSEDREGFIDRLFEILRQWAYSESGLMGNKDGAGKNGVFGAYLEMNKAGNTDETKYKFVEYCANLIGQDGSEWKHNQAEKIAAIALLDIMNGEETGKILASIDLASSFYSRACVERVVEDIKRDYILLNLNEKKIIVHNMDLLTQEAFGQELLGAQIDFVKFLCDQGKAVGAFLPTAMPTILKTGDRDLTQGSIRVISIIKKDDNVYAVVMNSYHQRALPEEGQDPVKGPLINTSVIYDITNFRDKEYKHSFGIKIPIRLILECTKTDLRDLQIPRTLLTRSTTELDKCLESTALKDFGLIDAWKIHVAIIDPSQKNPATPHSPVPEIYEEEIVRCQTELESRISQPLEDFLQNLFHVENNPPSSSAAVATLSASGDDDAPPVFSAAATTSLWEEQLQVLVTTRQQLSPPEEVASAPPVYPPAARGLSEFSPAEQEKMLVALALRKSAEEAAGKGARVLGSEVRPREVDRAEEHQELIETPRAEVDSIHEGKDDDPDPPNLEASTPILGDAQGAGQACE